MKRTAEEFKIVVGEKNPILRTVSQEVENIDKNMKDFCVELIEFMKKYDGLGLAAPQVGENIRVIAFQEIKETNKGYSVTGEKVMINPVISFRSKKTEIDEEGCLSLPGIYGNVKRNYTVSVEYRGVDGKEYKNKFYGLNARVLQHEIDHLDGILFVDRMEKSTDLNLENLINNNIAEKF